MSEQQEIKVGDKVRLTGDLWASYSGYNLGDPATYEGEVVEVTEIDHRSGAIIAGHAGAVGRDGTLYSAGDMAGYGVELVEDDTPAPTPEETTDGVWALIDRDHSETIVAVYPSELDALRVLNGRGFGRVAFVEWGEEIG